jgi:pyruvate dehydrogenase E2 component (dihydrolipoamide acetyltransferase)
MAFSVQMPALGESVTEGTVTRWLKQEGDHVDVDEPLLEVSTDKVDTEIPSPAAGTLERIVVAEDETVEVGAELAVIGDGASGGDSGGGEQRSQPAEEPAPAEDSSEAAEPEAAPEPTAEPEPAAAQSSASHDSGSGSSSGASTAVSMPALGESVTEGVVTRWLKQVGDHVDVDEPLLEVSTDKVDTEIPSPVAGTLLEISAGEDETVEVGGQLALIGDGEAGSGSGSGSGSGDAPSQAPAAEAQPQAEEKPAPKAEEPKAESGGGSPWREPEQRAPAAAAAPAAEAAPKQAEAPADTNGSAPEGDASGSPYVTPLVRKLAAEHGVDLNSVHGTGVGGRIRKQDVLAAAEKPAEEPEAPAAQPAAAAATPAGVAAASAAPAAGEPSAEAAAQLRGTTQKLTRLRGVIAERMVESLQVSAQLTAVVEVDVTRVAQLRQRAKAAFQAREGAKLTFLPFFVKATVDALKLFPQLNASVDVKAKQVTYHDAEHIGIAVDTEKGLIVPVLHNAGDLNLAGLARGIADLAQRTRTNKIKPDELSGGTFTISNIGSFGSLIDTPIINQPQVGILGTGAVVKRPVVITDELGQDTIAIRSIASLVLTYDHRLVDGADAGRFLTAVKRRIETGAFEAEVGL